MQAPSEVVIVSIDKSSSEKLNLPEEPRKWQRSVHARLIDALSEEGAGVIAFDIFFEDPHSVEEDTLFAEALSNAGNVILSERLKSEKITMQDTAGTSAADLNIFKFIHPFAQFESSAAAVAPFPLPKRPVRVNQYWAFKTGAGDMPTLPVVALQTYTLNVYNEFLNLMKKTSPSHSIKLPPDRDAILNSGNLSTLIQNIRDIFKNDPQIATKMLAVLQSSRFPSEDIQGKQKLKVLIKLYQGSDSRYLNFYGPPRTISTIPYYQALPQNQGTSTVSLYPDVKGKAVFIGLSELLRPEQKDTFYTVFSDSSGSDISGVEIAATAFANILEDMHVQPVDLRTHIAIIFFWGFALGFICRKLSAVVSSPVVITLSVVYLITAEYQFKTSAIWYPLFTPLLVQTPLVLVCSVICKYRDTRKERDHIRKALGYYLPDDLVERLSRNIADIKKNDQIVYGICLSTDAGQYTSLSETMSPEELSRFMNKYYEVIFEPVKKYSGVVSNVVGDSMLAIWVSAQPAPFLIRQASLAAIEIARAVRMFNQNSQARLPIRIGLHSGTIFLGNVGAVNHYEYRPVGDIVNTSTRLEGLNKYLGTEILASEEVISQIKSASDEEDVFLTREIGKFLFVGKSVPVVVHELICSGEDSDERRKNSCVIFAEALDAFRKRSWADAINKFNESFRQYGEDGPSRFYLDLCEYYRNSPAGEAWDGLIQLEKK